MNKNLHTCIYLPVIFLSCILLLPGIPSKAQTWRVYDGANLLTDAANSTGYKWVEGDKAGTNTVATVITDYEGNKSLSMVADPTNRSSFKTPNHTDATSLPENGTLLFRAKSDNWGTSKTDFGVMIEFYSVGAVGAANRFDFRLRGGDTIRLNNEAVPLFAQRNLTLHMYHTYRITVETGNIYKVYIDENPQAICAGVSTNSTSGNKFIIRAGNFQTSGTFSTNGEIDWMAWDSTGAYAPGTLLPAGVKVDIAPVAKDASNILKTGFTANWNTASTALGYRLDVATDSDFVNTLVDTLGVGNVTSFDVTGLSPNMVYFYRVRSTGTTDCTLGSNVIKVSTLADPPAVPNAIAATRIGSTRFLANWDAVSGAAGYKLDVATDNVFTSFVSGYENLDIPNITTYLVEGLSTTTSYYYRVRAYQTGGISTNSNIIGLTTAIPAPIANEATGITQTHFTANWDIVEGATNYALDVATDIDFNNYVDGFHNIDVMSVTTYLVETLNANTEYFYRVRAFNAPPDTSDNSNTISVTTLVNIPGAVVASNASDINQTSFTANWNASATATGYRIDVATDAGFTTFVTGFNNKDVANVTTCAVTGLAANTIYYYRVRAYNAGGTTGNSNPITVTTLLNAPVAIDASGIEPTSFMANWNTSETATGYRLDVANDAGFTSFVTGFNNLDVANVTTYLISGLTENTTYHYRVRAYNAGGTSISSNIIDVTTLVTAITTVSDGHLSIVAGNNEIQIASNQMMDELQVIDITGSTILQMTINSDLVNINTYDWKSGIYFLKVRSQREVLINKINLVK